MHFSSVSFEILSLNWASPKTHRYAPNEKVRCSIFINFWFRKNNRWSRLSASTLSSLIDVEVDTAAANAVLSHCLGRGHYLGRQRFGLRHSYTIDGAARVQPFGTMVEDDFGFGRPPYKTSINCKRSFSPDTLFNSLLNGTHHIIII